MIGPYQESLHRQSLERLAKQLEGLGKAVDRLAKAVEEDRADAGKLTRFRSERRRVQAKYLKRVQYDTQCGEVPRTGTEAKLV